MATRSRKEEKRYYHHRQTVHKKVGCIFCNIDKIQAEILQSSKSFYVIRNIFPYTQWDGQGVTDHLMIVPKAHTPTLTDLTSHQASEFVEILSSYENQGYNIYARSPGSNRKTVYHQHTHLIKLDGNTKKIIMSITKPYVRFVR